jgi:hypothetical protein
MSGTKDCVWWGSSRARSTAASTLAAPWFGLLRPPFRVVLVSAPEIENVVLQAVGTIGHHIEGG